MRGAISGADACTAGREYAARVPLLSFEVEPSREPLPPAVAAYLAAAQTRIDRYFAAPEHRTGIGFVPSDHEAVFRTLAALTRAQPDLRRFLEWGSGFGVVTGLAALLGLEACGIEIDARLVAESRALLAAHGLRASIAHGSFVPAGLPVRERLVDDETRTVLDAADGYGELERDLDDFDLVFAYPWPTEEELYGDLFRRRADHGAVLLTWSRTEGARCYRKLARGARRR
jgi:SAM-dependent methyltransferase